MFKSYQFSTTSIFLIGLLVLPVVFGSAAGAAVIIISLIWQLTFLYQPISDQYLPKFLTIWVGAATVFFILFAFADLSWEAIKFGFNTFVFILTMAVFMQFRRKASNPNFYWIFFVALIGLFIGAGWAFYQHDFVGVRRISTLLGGGPNLAARISILLAFISMTLLILDVNRCTKLLTYVFAFSAALLIVVYSGSRGALMAIPLLLVLPVLFALPTRALKSFPAWCGIFIFGACVVGFISWWDPNGIVTSILNRFQSVATGAGMDRSTELRYQMWQVAFQSFLEHPIIGTGWHSFIAVTDGTMLESYAAKGQYFNFHSDIANFAVAGGIVGLTLYFLLLFAPLLFWDTPKDHPYFRVRLYWAVTMPILYLVLGLTDMVMGFDYPTMFYAFSFAIIWGLTDEKKSSDTDDLAQAPAVETDCSR